jgi:hypothetical protein
MRYYGLKRRFNLLIFKLRNSRKERFECPICGYHGPFLDKVTYNGIRKHEVSELQCTRTTPSSVSSLTGGFQRERNGPFENASCCS